MDEDDDDDERIKLMYFKIQSYSHYLAAAYLYCLLGIKSH